MALPESFTKPEQYFEECQDFFAQYQNLFNFANTKVLVKTVLDHIEIENLENIDIHDEKFDLEAVNDEFLNRFFENLNLLKVFYDDIAEDKYLEDIFDVPLRPKKKHEIVYLAKEIKESCEKTGCDTVVDFGAGLGYLDQLVFETTNFKVLGLECNENHYVAAKKRQRKYHENSKENVKYIRHTVTEDSSTNIEIFLDEKFGNHREFCITGLHACADLTVDAINIFLKMTNAKSLVLMPCCYHKMASKEHGFKNFPLSNCMKNIFEINKGFKYMKVPFLRLGAQPPNGCEKLEDSVFNLLARAVLELYAQKNNCKLKRNKRKAVKTKTMDNDFENYIKYACSHGFTLIKNEPSCCVPHNTAEFDLDEIRSLWRQIDRTTEKKAGIFILLQNYLQPVIENVILFDRLIYLRENGIENCKFRKIFNEKLSPRCLALIASK